MKHLTKIKQAFGENFNILDGRPAYITVEQLKSQDTIDYEGSIDFLMEIVKEWELKRVGISLIRSTNEYLNFSKILSQHGFTHYSSKVNVIRDLANLSINQPEYCAISLESPQLTEAKFKDVWQRCMFNSDNHPSTLTIDEHLNSVKSELGMGWEKSCNIFYDVKKPLGLTIPHIEPGTTSEGRLFYFGMLPEERGKGISSMLHLQSLTLLKEMGATYYIGSTHLSNKKMQRVFEKNECTIKHITESFYKYFD